MVFFCTAVGLYLLGALLSFILGRSRPGLAAGPLFAVAGSLAGLAAVAGIGRAPAESLTLPFPLPLGAPSLLLDDPARFFLLPVFILTPLCAVYGAGYLKGHDQDKNLGAHWGFYLLTAAGMAVVMAAADGFFFLLAWEIMSLAPFFLISLDDEVSEVREAAWIYLVAAHLGAAALVAFFALWAGPAGSMAFADLARIAPGMSPGLLVALFALALAGFGAKAGLFGLHVWLPEAHPAAPSHVSALLSGALVNAGIYGLYRFTSLLGPPRPWMGPVLLAAGLATALFGIAQSLPRKNLKRLLALSTVENMGIVVMGLGAGLTALASGNRPAAFFGLVGALIHMLNHTFLKGLLFLAAGSVLSAAHTACLDHLGGLVKRMPRTAALFGLGAAGIAGLPPLAGFVGELCIFLSLAGALASQGVLARLAPLVGLVGLAAVGGLALASFARASGMVFLGLPRSAMADHATDPPASMVGPMCVLAALALVGGLAAPLLVHLAAPAAAMFCGPFGAADLVALAGAILGKVALAGWALVLLVLALAGLRRLLPAARRPGLTRVFRTWDCGYAAPDPSMQYTPASFADPLIEMLGPSVGTLRTQSPPEGYFPASAKVTQTFPDPTRAGFWDPLFESVRLAGDWLKRLQHGRIHLYILYMLAVLVGLLVWELW